MIRGETTRIKKTFEFFTNVYGLKIGSKVCILTKRFDLSCDHEVFVFLINSILELGRYYFTTIKDDKRSESPRLRSEGWMHLAIAMQKHPHLSHGSNDHHEKPPRQSN